MKIVERCEHEGAWWGQARDGAWFRWNMAIVGWEGPLTPPWTSSDVGGPATTSGPSAALEPPPTPPRNLLDAWWKRTFPPFSIRRLVFGLVALPVIGALQELALAASGRDPSLPRFLFVCLAGGAVLASAWLPGMRKYAKALAPDRWRPRTRDQATPETSSTPRTSFGKDFLVAFPFCFAIVVIVQLTVSGPGETFTGGSLLAQAVAAALAALMVVLRSSIWGLLLFSVVGGLLGGFAAALLSLMTFSDPGGNFVWGWVLGSVILFVHGYPVWHGLRSMEARGIRFPMWIVMGGSVVLVSGAALMFLAEH
jgi:hypothetical protein